MNSRQGCNRRSHPTGPPGESVPDAACGHPKAACTSGFNSGCAGVTNPSATTLSDMVTPLTYDLRLNKAAYDSITGALKI